MHTGITRTHDKHKRTILMTNILVAKITISVLYVLWTQETLDNEVNMEKKISLVKLQRHAYQQYIERLYVNTVYHSSHGAMIMPRTFQHKLL